VEPVRHHLPRQNGSRLAGEDEESGLKSIFSVVVAEEAAADAPDHRAVPLDEGCESSFIPTLNEAAEELSIGQPRPVLQQHGRAKLLDDLARLACRHAPRSAGIISRPLPVIRRSTAV
jgi:hypothetical protein